MILILITSLLLSSAALICAGQSAVRGPALSIFNSSLIEIYFTLSNCLVVDQITDTWPSSLLSGLCDSFQSHVRTCFGFSRNCGLSQSKLQAWGALAQVALLSIDRFSALSLRVCLGSAIGGDSREVARSDTFWHAEPVGNNANENFALSVSYLFYFQSNRLSLIHR